MCTDSSDCVLVLMIVRTLAFTTFISKVAQFIQGCDLCITASVLNITHSLNHLSSHELSAFLIQFYRL